MEQILVPDAEGLSTGWHKGKEYPVQEEYDLCRCGQSKNKPFCDLIACRSLLRWDRDSQPGTIRQPV